MAMGFEVEMHRRITDAKDALLEGDTKLLLHPEFTLVSDKLKRDGVRFSNMELVVTHFDQLTVSEPAAIATLTDRISAIRAMWTELYAKEGPLGTVVSANQGAHQIQFYNDATYGETKKLLVKSSPKSDDQRLYVHYTVGFRPSDWEAMLNGIRTRQRPDGQESRSATHLINGLAMAASAVRSHDADVVAAGNRNNVADVDGIRRELRGHLALLYMHAAVFIDRTLDLALEELNDNGADATVIKNVTDQLHFGEGLPKNKIAALPRTSLADLWGLLSKAAQEVLELRADEFVTCMAQTIEQEHGLDFPEKYKLTNKGVGSATLIDFINAGLMGLPQYSQQILFGGMNEVGVDYSVRRRPMVPFEFRQIFGGRVDWATFEANATSVLTWSRSPATTAL